MLKLLMRFLVTLFALLWGFSFASPSAFPETAAFFKVGYNGALVISAGGELLLPARYLDVSAGGEAIVDTQGGFGVRLDGTVLVFPAIGTVPPLALGLGADMGLSNEAFSLHFGPIIGSDLLFVSDLPMTASIYLAPGYATNTGFSLAWAALLRYYFDAALALELASTDIAWLSLSVRYSF